MMSELIEAQKRFLLAKQAMSAAPPIEHKPRINLEALEKGGFPKRNRRELENMHGPGLIKAQEILPRILAGDALILLTGDRGPGKTQMATWWAAQRTYSGKSAGRYLKTADLVGSIKNTWHQTRNDLSERDLIEQYKRTRYLVLDEFHERGASDWEARILINIIDHRYDEELCTVIICNCNREGISHVINSSILDRANQTGGHIHCNWPSYRGTR